MLEFPRWRVVLCALAIAFGVIFSLPNLLPDSVMNALPSWAPHQKLNLGLDLQGGSYLLLEVDTDALKTERLTNLVEDARSALQTEQIQFTGLGDNAGNVTVHITDPTQVQPALDALQKLAQPMSNGIGKDLLIVGLANQTIQISVSEQALTMDSKKAVDQDIEIVRRRIDALGTKEPTILKQGENRIVVEAPGESDPERLKAVIGQTAKLTFQMVDDATPIDEAVAGHVPPDDQLLPSDETPGVPMLVKRRAVVSGEMLTGAQQSFDQNQQPDITFRFNGAGAARFADATTNNVGKRFAIVIDNKILSAPRIGERDHRRVG